MAQHRDLLVPWGGRKTTPAQPVTSYRLFPCPGLVHTPPGRVSELEVALNCCSAHPLTLLLPISHSWGADQDPVSADWGTSSHRVHSHVFSPAGATLRHHGAPAGMCSPILEEPRERPRCPASVVTTPAPPTQFSKAFPRSLCGTAACKAGVCRTLAKATCIFNSAAAHVVSAPRPVTP